VRTLFGDGAAATLLSAATSDEGETIGPFIMGTDGRGGANLICTQGGFRNVAGEPLYMNGPEIFNFTIKAVPIAVDSLLQKAGLEQDDVDLFVFHQANAYMLEHLRKKVGIPHHKFVVAMENSGNTVSATIPIALKVAALDGRLVSGMRVMVVGFGVGYSWGAAMLRW